MAIEFNGLRADVARGLIENKSLLAQSGSIYVGTGKTQLINNKNVPITEALVPPETQGLYVLKCTVSPDGVANLYWDEIQQ